MANGRHRGGGRRTDFLWTTFGDVELTQDLSQPASFGTTSLGFTDPGTLTRVRGKVAVVLDAAAADESAMILVGLAVMNAEAVAGGIAPEIFGDSTQDEASWLWQGALYVNSGTLGAIATDSNGTDMVEIDSKAMRRVKGLAQVLVLVHEAPTELQSDQGGTYDLTYFVHALVGS